MKVIILAGGFGTRIIEESRYMPKPLVEIGGRPVLWHIMKLYSHYGYNEFIICAGYRQELIKEYFANYFLHSSDVTFDFSHGKNEMTVHRSISEPWRVTVVDTGLHTMTGGRVRRVRSYVEDETFMLTYGDAVCDIDIGKLVEFHRSHRKIATLTSVIRTPDKGILDITAQGSVKSFREKQLNDGVSINAGFMVLESAIFDCLDGDDTILETEPLQRLANAGQLMSYRHAGFWKCMDTQPEKEALERLWEAGAAPWKVWE